MLLASETLGVPVDGAGSVTPGMEACVTAGLRRPPCPVKVPVSYKNKYRYVQKRQLKNKKDGKSLNENKQMDQNEKNI